ncbi:lipopolysaccharide-induced tumor necrosis factor-alpha factor homolog [Plodia interpunctella]|uniref:lipopolysaccharide-induced tumor necrosis factor-alpha factor homolog n=1 Tax=Plodia interpunctella TaxID=58824 RepID=UPI0023680D84|nr:lipopolysaccharide-induced tumor necrosis factor-alpha factor homolog [Plodia interpunctella]
MSAMDTYIMDSDTIPLNSEIKTSQSPTKHIDDAYADGMILAAQNAPPPVPPPTNIFPVPLGPNNTKTICQYCHASVRTSVRYTSTTRTHMIAALCCMLCCCCCIPYCMKSTRNCDHYCPNCSNFLGTYHK